MIYKNEVLNVINKHLRNENSTHFIIRCPYCGDSKKNPHKGHLYLAKDKPVFRCVRCEEAGSIQKLLFDLTSNRYRLSTLIYDEYIKRNDLHDIKYNITQKDNNLIIPELNIDKFKDKHNYLYSRIPGKKVFDVIKDRLIYDVDQWIKINNLVNYKSDKLIQYLHTNFIGFVSYNKGTVIFRNIDRNSDFRYYIFKLTDFITDFFLIDNLKEEKEDVNLVVGEGIFDILNVYNYENEIDLLVNASGKLFLRAIEFVRIVNCISYFRKIIILGEDDVDFKFYKNVYKKIKNFTSTVELWYNKKGHDFGLKHPVEKTVIVL